MSTQWKLMAVLTAVLALDMAGSALEAEELYNGIQLPSPWPPKAANYPDQTVLPAPPYYVTNPPAVIPINVGRQLFVDDFLVAQTTLTRTWHPAEYYPTNPILPNDRPWEFGKFETLTQVKQASTFFGGVFYDPSVSLFKMWYAGAEVLCLATSTDGIQWNKPDLDVVPQSNVVKTNTQPANLANVWLDLHESDPNRRYKGWGTTFNGDYDAVDSFGFLAWFSADGIHWGNPVYQKMGYNDVGAFFYNPFRQVWGFDLRDSPIYWPVTDPTRLPQNGNRRFRYHEGQDFLGAMNWGTVPEQDMKGLPGEIDNSVRWQQTDSFDRNLDGTTDLYDVQANAYESLMIGGFSVRPGSRDGIKLNYISLGFSRDGFTFYRPNRQPFMDVGAWGAWNSGYLHCANGMCVIVGDKLHFYVASRQPPPAGIERQYNTGLATLRRDGFASMDAEEDAGAVSDVEHHATLAGFNHFIHELIHPTTIRYDNVIPVRGSKINLHLTR